MYNFQVIFVFLLFQSSFALAQNQVYVCPPCQSACDKMEYREKGKCTHCKMNLITQVAKNKMSKTNTIAFYLQDGVEVLDFAGPMEAFSYAGFEIFTVSKTTDPIKSQGVLSIIPDYSIDNAPEADIVAFFGGNSQVARQDDAVIAWVKKQSHVQYYFSVCTGAFILAEAGLLKGKKATTFHSSIDLLQSDFPETEVLSNVRFVDNGKIVTTAGISAGIDGALHLIAKLRGLPKAKEVVFYMEYDKWQPGEGLLLEGSDKIYSNN